MPRMSHYGPRKGLNVYLTDEEKQAIGTDRVDASLHLKSDKEFIRLHPNPHGRYGLTPQQNARYPWRCQLAGQEALPPFAVEAVEAQVVAGGVLAISKPKMMVEPFFRSTGGEPSSRAGKIERAIKRHRKAAQSSEASSHRLTLREAIEAINSAWAELGGDLEISVDPDNHKVTARHMVEY